MTRTIIGVLGATLLTAGVGVGGVTVYKVRHSNAEPVTLTASAAPEEPEPATSVQVEQNGQKQRVSVGGIVVTKDGARQGVKLGSGAGGIEAEQNGQKQSVKIGKGVSVEQNGKDGSVQIGGTRVEQNGKHVSIGGIRVDQAE